jgi:hypothetical protein
VATSGSIGDLLNSGLSSRSSGMSTRPKVPISCGLPSSNSSKSFLRQRAHERALAVGDDGVDLDVVGVDAECQPRLHRRLCRRRLRLLRGGPRRGQKQEQRYSDQPRSSHGASFVEKDELYLPLRASSSVGNGMAM